MMPQAPPSNGNRHPAPELDADQNFDRLDRGGNEGAEAFDVMTKGLSPETKKSRHQQMLERLFYNTMRFTQRQF